MARKKRKNQHTAEIAAAERQKQEQDDWEWQETRELASKVIDRAIDDLMETLHGIQTGVATGPDIMVLMYLIGHDLLGIDPQPEYTGRCVDAYREKIECLFWALSEADFRLLPIVVQSHMQHTGVMS